MNDIEKLKCLLTDFNQSYDDYLECDGVLRESPSVFEMQKLPNGFNQVIVIPFDCSYGAKFVFDPDGAFLHCELAP